MSKKFPKLPIELEPTEKPLESDSTLIAGLKVVYNDETLPKDEHNDQLVKNRKAMLLVKKKLVVMQLLPVLTLYLQ